MEIYKILNKSFIIFGFHILVYSNLLTVVFTQHLGCELNIETGISRKEPLFFEWDRIHGPSLLVPVNGILSFDHLKTFIISCPGTRTNYLQMTNIILRNVKSTEVQCNNGLFKFRDSSKMVTVDFTTVSCTTSISATIPQSNQACGDGGRGQLFNIGWDVEQFGFVKYFESCFNNGGITVIYTRHILHGTTIKHAYAVDDSRPIFKVSGITRQQRPTIDTIYRESVTRINNLVDYDLVPTSGTQVAKGHLTPHADGIFRGWQHATYFYMNAAPEWQAVNIKNWYTIEDNAREIANNMCEDLLIFTGVHDILTLTHRDRSEVPIMLSPGKVPFPKWFWKIIKSTVADSAIAFITYNNIFATPTHSPCTDICRRNGWVNTDYMDFTRGYTYCCNVTELIGTIPDIPNEASATNILKGDNLHGRKWKNLCAGPSKRRNTGGG